MSIKWEKRWVCRWAGWLVGCIASRCWWSRIGIKVIANTPYEQYFGFFCFFQLGAGAFSVVKEGTNKKLGGTYAIKIVTKAKLTEEDEAALQDEISVLKELQHPNIIRLYDVFDEKQYYYLVTECMNGGELFDRIVQKSYYNEKEARDTCLVLFRALQFCHDHQVAHRDLKPENLLLSVCIFLGFVLCVCMCHGAHHFIPLKHIHSPANKQLQSTESDSNIKLADFGFAKKCLQPDSLRTQCGTPGYVAPEILEGVPYGTQADMWSIGVIVYILLGGYPPFIEQNQRELFRRIRKAQYKFHDEYWSQVSTEAKDLIKSLLTVDPKTRMNATDVINNDKWINAGAEMLAEQDLGINLVEFKKFNAKRKFKAAVKTVMATQKLTSLGMNFQENLS
jgi:calcium/calmodulin-dependent protein kinase I